MSQPAANNQVSGKHTRANTRKNRAARPVGRKTAAAITLSADWEHRQERALLVLLAILADENRRRVDARKLAKAIDVDVQDLDKLLHTLAARRLLWTTRRPQRHNQYTLLFAGDRVPACDRDRWQRWIRRHAAQPRSQTGGQHA